ncbi:MAG: hypothetical protein NVS1B7_2370 [Candidatus Saccharimonadales bacterium]
MADSRHSSAGAVGPLALIDTWHKTTIGYVVAASLELVLAYLVGSRALDTGSGWEYLLTAILLFGGVHNFIKSVAVRSGRK